MKLHLRIVRRFFVGINGIIGYPIFTVLLLAEHLAFLNVLMTYFGVNLLGGMHAY